MREKTQVQQTSTTDAGKAILEKKIKESEQQQNLLTSTPSNIRRGIL